MRGSRRWSSLEVALALAIFHGGLGEAIVDAGRAALGDAAGRGLADDLVDRAGRGAQRGRAGRVADGAEADLGREGSLAGPRAEERGDRHQHPVALEDLALVGEVERRQLDALAGDVLPDVELGP